MSELIKIFNNAFAKATILNDKQFKVYLKGYQFSEVHCIELVKHLEKPNVTKLAEKMNMTKGGVSKLTKKLISSKDIEPYQIGNNKKEVYFRLTDKGNDLYLRHNELHDLWKERETKIINMVTEDETKVIINFLNKLNEHIDIEIEKLDFMLK